MNQGSQAARKLTLQQLTLQQQLSYHNLQSLTMMTSMRQMQGRDATKMNQGTPPQVVFAYVVFIVMAGAIWHLVAEGAFSSVLTMSVMMQCLGVVLLALQVMLTNSASGISAKTLTLDAIALICRLSSTLWLNGYLPVDKSGDHLFQFFELCSLGILVWLLHQIWGAKQSSYQAESDTFPVMPLVVFSFVLAILLHGNMNGRPLFDALWMVALFLSSIAVVPQLWLITRAGGRVEALTSHHIAAMAASNVLSGAFWWYARLDITCNPWVSGFNHTVGAIMMAHIVHVILLADFAYFYIKAVSKGGLNCRVAIETIDCGV